MPIPEELSTFARQKWWREAPRSTAPICALSRCVWTQADIYLTWREKAWHMAYEEEPPSGAGLTAFAATRRPIPAPWPVAYLGESLWGLLSWT